MKSIMKGMLVLALAVNVSVVNAADNGVVNVTSPYSVADTAKRYTEILEAKGMTIFNQVMHSKAAAKVGVDLRDTQLVIFGNPKIGSPAMACQQTLALDLPQKALIWKDESDQVWVSYNDPQYLKERHDVKGCDAIFAKVSKALGLFAKAATK